MSQNLVIGSVLRYPKPAKPEVQFLDGMQNFHFATRDARPDSKMVLLESGINASALVRATDGPRRPVILIRSSPAQAGTERTPWEDVIDTKTGIVTYFGDHRPDTLGPLGSTKGNKALEEAWQLYRSPDPGVRKLAPPIMFFVKVPWLDFDNTWNAKGAVRFLGPAVLDDMDQIEARDPRTARSYPNYRTRLRLLNLKANEQVINWNWINARKNPRLTLDESLEFEPNTWTIWREASR